MPIRGEHRRVDRNRIYVAMAGLDPAICVGPGMTKSGEASTRTETP